MSWDGLMLKQLQHKVSSMPRIMNEVGLILDVHAKNPGHFYDLSICILVSVFFMVNPKSYTSDLGIVYGFGSTLS